MQLSDLMCSISRTLEPRYGDFVVVRHIEASSTDVYRAWCDTQTFLCWIDPTGTQLSACDHTVTVGEVLKLSFHAGKSRLLHHEFKCVEHVPNRLLRYRAYDSSKPYALMYEYYVTVKFETVSSKDGEKQTLYTLRISLTEQSEIEAINQEGELDFWEETVDHLVTTVETRKKSLVASRSGSDPVDTILTTSS